MAVNVKKIYWLIAIMGIVFIVAGAALLLITFTMKSMTSDYPVTEAVISSIEKNAEDDEPTVLIDYSVNRRAYHGELGYYSSSYKTGDKIDIRYDPEDPTKVYVKKSFTLFMVLGSVILFSGVVALWVGSVLVQRS